jgi:beta-fructofuranosidase
MESSAVVAQGTTSPLLPYAYAPLPSSADDARENQSSGGGVRWRACAAVLAASAVVLLVVVGFFAGGRVDVDPAGEVSATSSVPGRRGKDFGMSEKASSADGGFPWSNAMLQWQHTGFHFQPLKHYMNGTFAVGFPDSDLQLLRPWNIFFLG